MISIPTVETKRLALRAHRLADFPDCAAMWADPLVTRFIGGAPSTEQQVWQRMTGYLGHWSLMGFGLWAIEEKESGKYIGEIGFADFKRDIDPPIMGIPEAGWAFASYAQGKGYATEALRAAVAWGEVQFGAARTVCIINPANLASIRVAEKCGYRWIRQALYKGAATGLYSREFGTRFGSSLHA